MSTTTAAPATNGSSNALNSSRQAKMNTAKGVEGQQRKPGSPVDSQRKPPQQKAWTQGTNPITQRSSNGIVNTPNKSVAAHAQVQSTSAPSSSSISSGDPMKHLSDRMMFLLANLIGLPGTITLKNGEKYSGVLSGTSLDPTEMRYVFKMVKRLLPASNAQTNGAGDISDDYVGVGDYHVMSFDMNDVADFNVSNVVLDKTQSKGQNGVSSGFRTDTDISGHMAVRERNLQKWEPSADHDASLSLEPTGRSNDWDQFATNEQLFGVKSNYDESFYTTTIDRSNPEYAARAARAEKIAREIEGSGALNAHVREERGQAVADDKGGDEEDKYSGVRREFPPLPTGQPNKYTPPARRPPTGQPTVPGAPVDPAIISSQIARPEKATPPAEKRATPEPSSKPEAKGDTAKLDTPKEAPAKTEVKTNIPPIKPATEQAQKPSAALKPAVAGIPARKSRPDNATANVEHDLLDSFKQFSAAEKLRMSERQRNIARESKAVKLNDLKKFSLNFKLNTPVPTDLVPILAKDETKQALIVEKALRTVKELSSTPPKPAATTVDAKAGAKPAATTPSSKPEVAAATHASPSATLDRNQQRPRPGQNQYGSATMRERTAHQNVNQNRANHGLLSTRLQLNQQAHKQQGGVPYNNVPQPIPVQDMRAPPTGPSQSSSGVQTPTSSASARFNAGAREFKPNPAAHTFQPGGNPSSNSSPRPDSAPRQPSEQHQQPQPQQPPRRTPAITAFFAGGQRPSPKPLDLNETFNSIKRLEKEAQDGDKTHNGGIQPPFRTPPTWDFPETHGDKGYKQMFEHSAAPTPISAPHNNMGGGGPMPHQHQLPPHLQGPQVVPQNQTPHHTPRGPPVQPHHGQNPHHFEAQHMQFSHSTSSVHPSPRPMPPYMYGSQPQPIPGFPQQVPMQQHGMSPGHVAIYGAQGGPQFVTPRGPAMGGQMMTNQPSNGPFMGMPPNPQMPMYSPAPAPAYPQYPGHMPPGPGANGFPSPRPGAPMMAHQGSQQGHQQQPMMYIQQNGQGPPMFQVPPGSMTPMRGPYAQPHQPHYGSPHQHHQFPHQAHRGTPSGSYSQPMMQQHSMPPQGPPTGPANHGQEGNEEPK